MSSIVVSSKTPLWVIIGNWDLTKACKILLLNIYFQCSQVALHIVH